MRNRLTLTAASVLYDVLYALRGLRNALGYAASVVLTLALGLGVTTAMLAIVDCVLLRPLAFPHAEQMESLRLVSPAGVEQWNVEWANYESLRDGIKGFRAIAAYSDLPEPVTTQSGSEVLPVVHATPGLFDVTDVQPVLGRVLTAADAHLPSAVIGNSFWRESLHADAHVLGQSLRVGGKLLTIVGVMPAAFTFPSSLRGAAVYTPLEVNEKGLDSHNLSGFTVVARRKPGVSRAVVTAEGQIVQEHLPVPAHQQRKRLVLRPYLTSVVGEQSTALYLLLAACGVLLAIACVNAANLQIARSTLRSVEMMTRAALGASRGRLLRQIVTESVTVSSLGASLGLGLALALVHATRVTYGEQFPRFDELQLHWPAFAGCAVLAILSGLLASIAPSLGVLRSAYGEQRTSARVSRRSAVSSVLVMAELALTCMLLIACGLFLRTFQALQRVPLGLSPDGVTTTVLMPEDPTQKTAAQKMIYTQLVERMEHLPGVSAASFAMSVPFSNFGMSAYEDFHLLGGEKKTAEGLALNIVEGDFFRAFKIPLRAGRVFDNSDSSGSLMVGVVNEEFVRKYVPDGRAVGREMESTEDMKLKQPVTIVGVVGDSISGNEVITEARNPMVYLLAEQVPVELPMAHFFFGLAPQFVIRSDVGAKALDAALRETVRREAPGFAVMSIQPMSVGLKQAMNSRRLALQLASGFGVVALLLGAFGIYGVLAYTVAQRRREIGIRMALGSTRERMLYLVIRQSGILCAAGIMLGFLAAWPAVRFIKSSLFGVSLLDPLTLLGVAATLGCVSLLAAAVPARRAATVDPIEALRSE